MKVKPNTKTLSLSFYDERAENVKTVKIDDITANAFSNEIKTALAGLRPEELKRVKQGAALLIFTFSIE